MFVKFPENHLCQSPKFIEKETPVHVFPSEFWEIFKNTFFYETPLVAASVGLSNDVKIIDILSSKHFQVTVYLDK